METKILTPRQSFAMQNSAIPLKKGGTPPSQVNDLIDGVIIKYDTIDSTSNLAKTIATGVNSHGTIITANHQTAGRGRFGRSFFSPAGHGIYMSLILHSSKIQLANPVMATVFAAVAVCKAIEKVCTHTAKKLQIKWVNDIFYNNKKICGILTEPVFDAKTGNIDSIVIGIGINFSTPQDGMPKDIENIAGAIFFDQKPTITKEDLINEVAYEIMKICNSNIPPFLDEYKSKVFVIGKKITVIDAGQRYEAIALDIDQDARLVVEKSTGEIIAISSGEVSIVGFRKEE